MNCRIGVFLLIFPLIILTSRGVSRNYKCEEDLIEVMFEGDAVIRLRSGSLVDLSERGTLEGLDEVLELTDDYQWERLSDLPEEIIDGIDETADLCTENNYNLNNIYRLRFYGSIDVRELSQLLQDLPGIISAIPVPLPQSLPVPPNYLNSQGYLKAASFTPTGIDAIYAWTQAGGTGTGVTVCDLEYSWNYNHNDLTKALGSQINNHVQDPFSNNNHGTAVLGEMVSDNNGWGTTGICYGAGVKTCGTYYGTSPSWNVSGAITVAIANLSPGDVILLEQQWDYTGSNGFVPVEWWGSTGTPQTFNAVYAAIQNAVNNGIHVVEAGGNGYINTDNLTWYGNSGAIIVGAGGVYPGGTWPNGDLQKLAYSSYGSRFDLQGWGEDVVTTGYGDLYSAEGVNYYYASGFSGTSSASPIVAGAVANCVGYWVANGNPASTLTPALLRTALSTTGTPQVTPPTGNIGPRPNLTGAFAYLYNVAVDAEYERICSTVIGVYPNPSSEFVEIQLFSSSVTTSINEFSIYDVSGRRVKSFNSEAIAGGEAIIWNFMDEDGRRVSSGLYLATAILESGIVTAPIIFLGR